MIVVTFLFGLAIFLLAMHELEQGIRQSSGDGLKAWVSGHTNSSIRSASSGVIVTAIMQSSSMVSLIVLAMVSAGLMPLFNGLGVVLGANLGTTVTGWVVTMVGFKMNLQLLVVPLLGIGAIGRLGFSKNPKVAGVGKALFAFGLLVYGLDIMKDSVSGLAHTVDMGRFLGMPAWVYLLIGVVMAAVTQSSSAVMTITLSMIHSDLITLVDAAALVIGADLGTTSTTVLGSFGESVVKKQLALGQVVFNFIVDIFAFFFLLPNIPELFVIVGVEDPMFGLVLFHSGFNLIGLLVFLPLLRFYTRLIEWILPAGADSRADYFVVPIEVPDLAISSLEKALTHLTSDVVHLSIGGFRLQSERLELTSINPDLS